jgi:hypothetical protein
MSYIPITLNKPSKVPTLLDHSDWLDEPTREDVLLAENVRLRDLIRRVEKIADPKYPFTSRDKLIRLFIEIERFPLAEDDLPGGS